MGYDSELVANVARIYHEIKISLQNLDATQYQGPNGIGAERDAVKTLRILLNSYKQFPSEVIELLDIDISRLEKIIS